MGTTTAFDYLTTSEIKQLLGVIDDARDRAIVILFLSTGLFLTELIAIQVTDINWEKRLLKLSGKRARELPLNDEAYNALLYWNKHRPKTPVSLFFLTEKGEVKGLSDRGLDHILRRYGNQAGFQKKISAQVLRGSFAVRLFEQGITLKEASHILGISDFESLKRYQEAAHPSEDRPKQTPKETVEHLDTRPAFTRLVSKLFPKDNCHPLPEGVAQNSPEQPDSEKTFGRDSIIEETSHLLNQGASVLLSGPLGIGKTHLLRHIASEDDTIIYLETPVPFKQALKEICDKAYPSWQDTLGSRASIQEMMDYINDTPLLCPPFLVIDHLERLKATEAENFILLMNKFTVLAATDDMHSRLQIVWWKFKEIEVPPLDEDAMKALIAHLTKSISITDYEMLENKMLSQSNGYPLAVVDMVRHLCHQKRVNDDSIRDLSHDVGTRYRDWTGALMIFWAGLVMCRFIALGTHSFEGYILAGFGTAIFGLFRYFLMRRR